MPGDESAWQIPGIDASAPEAFVIPRMLRCQRSPLLLVVKTPPRPEFPSTSPGAAEEEAIEKDARLGPASLAPA